MSIFLDVSGSEFLAVTAFRSPSGSCCLCPNVRGSMRESELGYLEG